MAVKAGFGKSLLSPRWQSARRRVCLRGILFAAGNQYCLPLATVASHVDAVDVDSNAIKIMCEFAEERGIKNITPFCGDLAEWAEGRDGTYDFIICTLTLVCLDPPVRRSFLEIFSRLLAPQGTLLVDFYLPRHFLYRAFVQNLTLKEKGFSFLAYFYRWVKGRHVTKRALLREAKQNNLVVVEQDHKAYFDCRKFEGYGFESFFGCDFEAYTLTPVSSSSSSAAGI